MALSLLHYSAALLAVLSTGENAFAFASETRHSLSAELSDVAKAFEMFDPTSKPSTSVVLDFCRYMGSENNKTQGGMTFFPNLFGLGADSLENAEVSRLKGLKETSKSPLTALL
ncbi:hypothetical protein LARI1_G004615 [Lachnellula arida]|uniref:Uncharacterized protein n=1 Tax=Lachnellula arida TaxID=1316785 RepID=A0A8T9B6E5_9HELO|nr:hypothetical protein LARI1_G004615 [Lachnellula arida]